MKTLLNEKWSISDQVVDAANQVIELVKYHYLQYKPKEENNICKRYSNTISITLFEEWNVKVEYNIYEFLTKEHLKRYINSINYTQSYNEIERKLILTFFGTYQTGIIEALTANGISHEVEHCFQSYKKNNNSTQFKPLTTNIYRLARRISNNPKNKNTIDGCIADLIYWSSSAEQDAYVNDYYSEIINYASSIYEENTDFNEMFIKYQHAVQWLNDVALTDDYRLAISKYKHLGVTPDKFIKYVNKQFKRLVLKKKHVDKLLHERMRFNIDETKLQRIIKEAIISNVRKKLVKNS